MIKTIATLIIAMLILAVYPMISNFLTGSASSVEVLEKDKSNEDDIQKVDIKPVPFRPEQIAFIPLVQQLKIPKGEETIIQGEIGVEIKSTYNIDDRLLELNNITKFKGKKVAIKDLERSDNKYLLEVGEVD